MNLMTIKRFKNELIILIALIFTLFAFGYKLSAKGYVQEEQTDIQKSIMDVSKVAELKKLWGNKNIANMVDTFKTIVNETKIKSFEKRSKKVVAKYQDLSVKELNKITNQLLKTPLQITSLEIKESSKEKFTMELTCKW